jgi:hypothetical protein
VTKPNHDHGIENEPQYGRKRARPDPSEAKADRTLRKAREKPDLDREEAEHSVFNEPAYLEGVDRVDPNWPSYRRWLHRNLETADPERAWRLAFLLMLAGGPWAVLGAFYAGGAGLLAIVVWGPVCEEIMKVAILATVIEFRPFKFTSRAQIHLAAMGSGLGFAIVENILYLNVYIDDPEPSLALWRWTICVALHVGCSLVASLGIASMWERSIETLSRPRMRVAFQSIIAAIVIHSAYNGLAMLLAIAGVDF